MVAKSGAIGRMIAWAQVQAQNTITARYPLEGKFWTGNVIGMRWKFGSSSRHRRICARNVLMLPLAVADNVDVFKE